MFIIDSPKKRIVRKIYWRWMPWQRKCRFAVLGWEVWL